MTLRTAAAAWISADGGAVPAAAPPAAAAPPPSLALALDKHCLGMDRSVAVVVVLVLSVTLATAALTRPEFFFVLALDACFAALWVLAAHAPGPFLRARRPLVAALRLAVATGQPLFIDVLAALDPGGAPGRGGAPAAVPPRLAAPRALSHFLVGVTWLQGSVMATVGMQLPPWEHLAMQSMHVLLLCRRAAPVCRQFVARSPQHGAVASAAFEAMRQLTSLLWLGSWAPAEGAAQTRGVEGQCVAVVCMVQVSLGLVLPTLVVWRAQLQTARRLVAEQRDGPSRVSLEGQLQRSPYARLCQPALEAAEVLGWLGTTLLAVLWSFSAAAAWQAQP